MHAATATQPAKSHHACTASPPPPSPFAARPPAAQVGMRYFHLNKNKYFTPIVNLDKLWSMVGEEVRGERAAACCVQHGLLL